MCSRTSHQHPVHCFASLLARNWHVLWQDYDVQCRKTLADILHRIVMSEMWHYATCKDCQWYIVLARKWHLVWQQYDIQCRKTSADIFTQNSDEKHSCVTSSIHHFVFWTSSWFCGYVTVTKEPTNIYQVAQWSSQWTTIVSLLSCLVSSVFSRLFCESIFTQYLN